VLHASYFDGHSAQIRSVDLSVSGDDLIIAGEGIERRVPISEVIVDEQLGRAARRLRLKDGTFCEVRDLPALAALLSSTTHRDGRVDQLQRRLGSVLLSLAACIVLAAVGYRFGLPWAAAFVAERLPPAVAGVLSAQVLRALDNGLLTPSRIAPQRRRALEAEFRALRVPDGTAPSTLLFRGSPQLKANAFTLPDGTIVVLDDLVTTLGDDGQILAVMAHELGHAHERHGLQLLLRSSAVGAFLAFYLGDISHLLAVAPAAVIQARYSQTLEWQADEYGAALLRRNGMSPQLLADALKKLVAFHGGSAQAGYLSSHPATTERVRHLEQLVAAH